MRAGRNQHFRRSRVAKEKRTISVPAQGEEQGRYYKCWNCGFIVDRRTSALDDGKAGNSHLRATLATGRIIGDSLSVKFRIGNPIILRQLDSLGNLKPVYIERRVTVGSGCPSCGSHNYA